MGESVALTYALALQRGVFALDASGQLPRASMTGLFGISGSGKTTLLRCLAGLEAEASGRVVVEGVPWQDSREKRFLPPWQRSVGYVFQDSRLFPHLDVAANLAYARDRARGRPGPEAMGSDELLGIDALQSRRVTNLSGGEQRRVAIARALRSNPSLLLLDEPLSGLDTAARTSILDALGRLPAVTRAATMFVSHDLDEIIQLCENLIVIDAGRVLRDGPIRELLADAALVGPDRCGVLIDAVVERYEAASGLTTLHCDGVRLRVPGRIPASVVRVHVLARDVSLSLRAPEDSSILNALEGRVVDIVIEGDHAQVTIASGGVRLLARVSRYSLQRLTLEIGSSVFALIKGVAVRPGLG